MFGRVRKTPRKASINASVSSTILALVVVWLNIFPFYKFLFLPIFKNDLQVLLYKTFIFIQTNIYVKTYTGMHISRCR